MDDVKKELERFFENLEECWDTIRSAFEEFVDQLQRELVEQIRELVEDVVELLTKKRIKYGECVRWTVKKWMRDKRKKVFRCRNPC